MIHSFDTDVAAECGLTAATLLHSIAFWIQKNAANNTHYYDGYYWTYNSAKAFSELFPYLTSRQVETAINKLCEKDYLQKGNYNANKHDRTLWYALTKKSMSIYAVTGIHLQKNVNGNTQKGEPIPDSIPDSKPDIDTTPLPPCEGEPPSGGDVQAKPVKKKSSEPKPGFDRFWEAYPKKLAKQDAVKAYNKIAPDGQLLEKMLAAISHCAATNDWQRNNGQFIPYPASWLNGKRWEDESAETQKYRFEAY